MFYGQELPECNVETQNKNKIQIYLNNADCVVRHNSLKVVDQANVRAISGNDLSI